MQWAGMNNVQFHTLFLSLNFIFSSACRSRFDAGRSGVSRYLLLLCAFASLCLCAYLSSYNHLQLFTTDYTHRIG